MIWFVYIKTENFATRYKLSVTLLLSYFIIGCMLKITFISSNLFTNYIYVTRLQYGMQVYHI